MRQQLEKGIIKRKSNKPYGGSKDPESTLLDIRKMLMSFNIDQDRILTRINYAVGEVMVVFEVKIPKAEGNVPLTLMFRPKARTKRGRVNGQLKQVFDLSACARQLFHKLYNKMNDVASGYSSEVEEYLAYVTYQGAGGYRTVLDQLGPMVESGKLALGDTDMKKLLALPESPAEPGQKGPIIIDAEFQEN